MLKSNSAAKSARVTRARVAIVAARYNPRYVNGMLRHAKGTLAEAGVRSSDLTVVRVPGAFEIPAVVSHLAKHKESNQIEAVIGLGVILQGATSHAEEIGTAVTRAFAQIQVQFQFPVIHEVLVFTEVKQAEERCLSSEYNRGREAALTALEMIKVMRRL